MTFHVAWIFYLVGFETLAYHFAKWVGNTFFTDFMRLVGAFGSWIVVNILAIIALAIYAAHVRIAW